MIKMHAKATAAYQGIDPQWSGIMLGGMIGGAFGGLLGATTGALIGVIILTDK